ncbi:MAG: serine/threonine protein kinase, partial [Nostoc sp.]
MLQPEQILQERYQIQRQLGNNGIRQTWQALDLQASNGENSTVVVKLLAFGGTVQWDDLKLFEREAQILKQLNHPRIPRYI